MCASVKREKAGLFNTIVVAPAVPAADSATPGRTILTDSANAFAKAYGDKPQLILVRPDGYIGFRAPPSDADMLRAYLGRVFPRSGG